ncbi:MAG: Na+/H+ antiporter NhaC family protein [Lachnospiraceae bacterium]|nr:Na+/H+ antiporter NhaC family protein [Lachnospiraceae bacterium]
MLRLFILGGFLAGLIVCVRMDLSILYALVLGLFLFVFYAKRKGNSWKKIGEMLLAGALKVKNILLVFVCIGCLTATWRLCGTIPYIVYHSSALILPKVFLLSAFLLNCVLSYLTGSSFAAVGTIGTICMMLGKALGVPVIPLGGAIFSGIYFGDRCSPMSSSALLVAEITETDIYANTKAMFRTAIIPFSISCVLYLLFRFDAADNVQMDSLGVLRDAYQLHWICLVPALLILVLCACKVDVKLTMMISTVTGILICLFLQKVPVSEIFHALVFGFHPQNNEALESLLGGGGILSMKNVAGIVLLSASFSGIFENTDLFGDLEIWMNRLTEKITKEGALLVTAVLSCMVCCNQSLGTILTNQITKSFVKDNEERASCIEDSTIVLAGLVPWSIACAGPLAILEVSGKSLFYAWYLYLLPVCMLLRGIYIRFRKTESGKRKMKESIS